MLTVNQLTAEQWLTPISEDEVIFSFLKSSVEILPPDFRVKLAGVIDNGTYAEKLVCREICHSIDVLQHFRSRHWYRAFLASNQLKFVRLGHESSDNFSKYFSRGTYKPRIAAHNILSSSELSKKRKMHRDKVIHFSESIEIDDLENVILCASKYTINRRLKTLDGNHRIIAYVLKHKQLNPFTCMVGFSKPLYLSLLQRGLLAFPFISDTKDALGFAIRTNYRRFRCIFTGGMNYQPLLQNADVIRQLASSTNDQSDESFKLRKPSERPCADRARFLRDDMRSSIEDFAKSTLLDIGCNVGFFCHFFAALGMQATGVENSQHNRHQRFSMSDSVRTANSMNHRYNLGCDFIEDDARSWVKTEKRSFDVVLLLSVLHHFFLGYPIGDYVRDPMEEARRFIQDVARITQRVLYIEYEDSDSTIPTSELLGFLRSLGQFRNVEIISYSSDFKRPIIRCLKH